MCNFRGNVAIKYGINAAIIAEYLWDKVNSNNYNVNKFIRDNRVWYRCSAVTITGIFPFLSRHQVEDAILILREQGILKKECFNENKFDHTSWYSFTEKGIYIFNN